MCRKCNPETFDASTDGGRAVEEPTHDGTNAELGAVPEANEVDLEDVEDANRRKFLKATGAAAGGTALVGASGTAAAAYECNVADRWDESPNQSDWRADSEINWIVVHITDCTYGTAINTFNDPNSNVSAHYVISNYDWSWGAPGEVTQMVEHNYKAWHAGPGNYHSIGIEHEMGYTDASWNDAGVNRYINDACYDSTADIIACCIEKYDISADFYPIGTGVCMQNNDGGIIGHQDVTNQYCNDYTGKSCPTYVYDFDKLENKVRARLDGGGGGSCGAGTSYKFAMDDDVVVSGASALNGREGPGLDYNVVDSYPEGEEGYIMNGPEWNDGITWWGVHFPRPNDWVWCSGNYLACNN